MQFASASKSRSNVINITSLLDVMFLLVIFLLIAAKYEREAGINVDLPTGKTAEKIAPTDLLYVTISSTGVLYIGDEKIARNKFLTRLAARRKTLKEPVLIIKVDKAAPSEHMIFVMDVAKQIKQTKIHIKAKP